MTLEEMIDQVLEKCHGIFPGENREEQQARLARLEEYRKIIERKKMSDLKEGEVHPASHDALLKLVENVVVYLKTIKEIEPNESYELTLRFKTTDKDYTFFNTTLIKNPNIKVPGFTKDSSE